jgi:hypothetical protein
MNPLEPMRLFEALAQEDVNYVLVGGLAAAMNGTTRVTRDIDIAYAGDRGNLERLCRAVNRFEPRMKVFGKREGRVIVLTPGVLKKQGVVQLVTSIGEVDLLDKLTGFHSFAYVRELSTVEDVGVPVRVLGIDGLLKAKRALKRPKDMYDIAELEALRGAPTSAEAPIALGDASPE